MEEALNQNIENLAPLNTETLASQEKMLRQSEVNEIVGRVRQEANAKLDDYKRSQEVSKQQPSSQKESSSEMNEDRVRKVFAEEAKRLREEAQSQSDEQSAHRIVKNFYDKISVGKQKYDDFDKVIGDIDLRRFPNTVHMLAENLDNSHDVLYELSKNRAKLASIEMTAREFPQEALHDLHRLSESIRKNEDHSNRREANAPLHQQRPSNIGTDSGGILSMRDLRNKYRV